MDSLDRLNGMYDALIGPTASSLLPSLEAIESDLRRHRDRCPSTDDYARLDAAIENVEEVRRGER